MTVKTTVLFRHRWNTPKLNSERRLEPVLIPQWPLMALASLNRSRRAESASELWSSGIGIIKFPSQRVSATTSLPALQTALAAAQGVPALKAVM